MKKKMTNIGSIILALAIIAVVVILVIWNFNSLLRTVTISAKADESCFLYKSTTLVIIKYAGTMDGCFSETDSMIKSGFRISYVVGDMNGYDSVFGRIYLIK
jgi:hypothetical protein